MSRVFRISWYVVLFASILCAIAGVIFLYISSCDQACGAESAWFNYTIPDMEIKESDRADWETFQSIPLPLKFLMFPYFFVLIALLLRIIKKSQLLFDNFKNEILFSRSNVVIISKIGKSLLWYSIMTFGFTSLIISIILLMACEVFKNGAALQEEHDLTI